MPADPTRKATPAQKRTAATKEPKAPQTAKAGDGAESPATLRLKGLVDRVAASTGGKKKGVKEIVEATLTQLGLALQGGEMLNLPDLGKMRVAKAQGATPGSAMTLKLRPAGPAIRKKPAEVALAEPADHS